MAEHLQWLDREIAASGAALPAPAQLAPAALVASPFPVVPPPAPSPLPAAVETAAPPDPALLALQEDERRRGEFSKSGCWIVFSALLLIVVGALAAVIMIKYR